MSSEQPTWTATDYGFTDGKHMHVCMATPDSQTCDYLNAQLAAANQKLEQVTAILKEALDRDWSDESPRDVAVLAANGIQNRDDAVRLANQKLEQVTAERDNYRAEVENKPKTHGWIPELLIDHDRPVCEICHGFVEEHEYNAAITDAYDQSEAKLEQAVAALEAIESMAGSNTVPLPPIQEGPAGFGAIYRTAAEALQSIHNREEGR